MIFSNTTLNGVEPVNDYKTKPSKFGLAVSSTATVAGRPVILKAISDAAMYKTQPVNFYTDNTPSGSTVTTTIFLGSATFVTSAEAPLLTYDIPEGSNNIYASWPGEGRYGPVSNAAYAVPVDVNPGVAFPGTITLYAYPASNTLIAGEGTATFTAIINASISLTDTLTFFDGNVELGTAPIEVATQSAQFSTSALSGGVHTMKVSWNGANVGGIEYRAISTTTQYTIKKGRDTNFGLVLSAVPDHGVYLEGSVTLNAVLTTSTSVGGNISFYKDGMLLDTTLVSNNSSSFTIPNAYPLGTSTFTASWDGNQPNVPSYITTSSNTVTWVVYSREIPGTISLDLYPSTSTFFSQPLTLIATFDSPYAITGNMNFYDDGIFLSTKPIVDNRAVYTGFTLNTGSHLLYAFYAGSATTPKYYSTASNKIYTLTEEGEALDFSVAFANTFTYVKEPIPLVFTNNSIVNASGTTATFYQDDIQISGTLFVCYTSGTTASNIIYSTGLNGLIPGTRLYTDGAKTNLLGTIVSNPGNDTTVIIDTLVVLPPNPLWFVGPNYRQLPNAVFSGNTAITTASFITTGTMTAFAEWNVHQIDDGHYYAREIDQAPSIQVLNRYLNTKFILSADQLPIVIDEPVTIKLVSSSSTDLTGTLGDIYVNNIIKDSQPFVGRTDTFSLTFNSTGSITLASGWQGGWSGDKYYHSIAISTGTATIITSVEPRRIYPTTIQLASLPIPQSTFGTLTFTATLLSTVIDGSKITFKKSRPVYSNTGTIIGYNNTATIGTSTVISNISTLQAPAGTLSSGTWTIQAFWEGQSVAPKYYATSTGYLNKFMFDRNRRLVNVSLNGITNWEYYAPSGQVNTTTFTATVIVSGLGYGPNPSGTLQIVNQTNTVVTSTNITNTGTYNLGIQTFISNIGQTSTYYAKYLGDENNLPITTTGTAVTLSKAIPILTYISSYAGTGQLTLFAGETSMRVTVFARPQDTLTGNVSFLNDFDSPSQTIGAGRYLGTITNFTGSTQTISLATTSLGSWNEGFGEWSTAASGTFNGLRDYPNIAMAYSGDSTHEIVDLGRLPFNIQVHPLLPSVQGTFTNYTSGGTTIGHSMGARIFNDPAKTMYRALGGNSYAYSGPLPSIQGVVEIFFMPTFINGLPVSTSGSTGWVIPSTGYGSTAGGFPDGIWQQYNTVWGIPNFGAFMGSIDINNGIQFQYLHVLYSEIYKRTSWAATYNGTFARRSSDGAVIIPINSIRGNYYFRYCRDHNYSGDYWAPGTIYSSIRGFNATRVTGFNSIDSGTITF